MASEKPIAQRLSETMEIIKNISDLGIPLDSPEVAELRVHLNSYVKEGICWNGSISFLRFGRIAEVNLPRRTDKSIEVTLRLPRAGK